MPRGVHKIDLGSPTIRIRMPNLKISHAPDIEYQSSFQYCPLRILRTALDQAPSCIMANIQSAVYTGVWTNWSKPKESFF